MGVPGSLSIFSRALGEPKMLNKAICQKCAERRGRQLSPGWERKTEGFMVCPVEGAFKIAMLNKPPPMHCMYYLEQLVYAQ